MAALRTGIHPQRVFAIATLLALAAFGLAAAQDRASQDRAPGRSSVIGAGGYISLGLQSGIFPIYTGSPECGLFTSEDVITGWVGAIYSRPSYFNANLGFTARLGWEGATSLYTAPPDDIQRIVDTTNHTLTQIDRVFRYEAAIRAVMLDLFARYETGRWGFEAGPRVGYRYAARFRQTDNVTGPGDASFADGERQHDMALGGVFTVNRFALGLGAVISYALPIGGNRMLVPGIVFTGDLLSIVKEQEWRSISIGAGAALQFDISPKAPPSPPPPVVAETPAPRRLEVGLKIRGMNAQRQVTTEAVINVRNVLYRQHAPLLPLVFFDAGSATIPERYVQLSSNASARFSMMAVPDMSQIEINHSVLNIIGTRLRENSAARLTLQGSVSDDETPALALERARAVRNYLVASWGIDRGRIEARVAEGPTARGGEAGEDERAESRRVLITSSDPNITAPIASERIVRDYDPPALKLEPTIDAEAGVRDWSITIRQGKVELARFNRGDEGTTGLTWQLDERLDSAIGTLTAELRVEDSTGQVKSASDQIALRINRGLRVEPGLRDRSDEAERLSYMLVAFDYGSSTLDPGQHALLAELAGALHDSARVAITGYTDRTGDDRTNIELSRQRAENAAEALRPLAAARGVKDLAISVSGAGVDTIRFPNDLPEGRILSRSAAILVEQPRGGSE
jgi:outer membrane protein OmpA-like peptidoglycan-associated protein